MSKTTPYACVVCRQENIIETEGDWIPPDWPNASYRQGHRVDGGRILKPSSDSVKNHERAGICNPCITQNPAVIALIPYINFEN